jgi:hypothetical protein
MPYKTLVIDSVTFMEMAARKWDQFVLNPRTEEPRQWYAASTEMLEQMLMMRLRGLPVNVIILCHVDHDKDELHGTFLRMPMAPGKLRGKLASAYSEYYRAYVAKDGTHWLQTRTDAVWSATTRINAPNPCPPTWSAIWSGWDGPQYPVHVLVYGDAGAGKSTFAATAPKPMLVLHFDPYGKEVPYLVRGKPTDLYADDRHDTVRSVMSNKTGNEIIRIEYYHDTVFTEPQLQPAKSRTRVVDMQPDAYHRFLKRMATVQHELAGKEVTR